MIRDPIVGILIQQTPSNRNITLFLPLTRTHQAVSQTWQWVTKLVGVLGRLNRLVIFLQLKIGKGCVDVDAHRFFIKRFDLFQLSIGFGHFAAPRIVVAVERPDRSVIWYSISTDFCKTLDNIGLSVYGR